MKYYLSINEGAGPVVKAYKTKAERDRVVRDNATARSHTRATARRNSPRGYLDYSVDPKPGACEPWAKW
jgi:hypothetical protein